MVASLQPRSTPSNAVKPLDPPSSLNVLPPTAEFEAKYTMLEPLGRGCYAEVRRCVHAQTQREFAVKCAAKAQLKETALRGLEAEVAILQRLRHPSLVHLRRAYNGPETVHLVMEYLPGGSLHALLARPYRYSEGTAAQLLSNLLHGLAYMHSQRVVHCDVKPENILLRCAPPPATADIPPDHKSLTGVKLADFGFARTVGEFDNLTRFCGTPYYIAPEIILMKVQKTCYGRPVDLWAVGVVLFVMLFNAPPFQGEERAALFDAIVRGVVVIPPSPQLSPSGRSFLHALLTADPQARMTATEALAHPWIARQASPVRSPSQRRQHTVDAESLSPTGSPTLPPADSSTSSGSPLSKSSARRRPTPRGAPGEHPPLTLPPTRSPSGMKKALVRREDLSEDARVIVGTLQRHPSVTQLDLSHDLWRPADARRLLLVMEGCRHVRTVAGAHGQRRRLSELRTVEDVLRLTAAHALPPVKGPRGDPPQPPDHAKAVLRFL